MSALAGARAGLIEALTTAGLSNYDYLPPQIHPPVVLIEPADPYLQDAETFGGFIVTFDLYVITRRGTGQTQTQELDELLVKTVEAVSDGWDLAEVGRPYSLQVASTRYLTATVTVQTEIRL